MGHSLWFEPLICFCFDSSTHAISMALRPEMIDVALKKGKKQDLYLSFFFLFILFNIICSSLRWSETAVGPLYIVNCCGFRGWGGGEAILLVLSPWNLQKRSRMVPVINFLIHTVYYTERNSCTFHLKCSCLLLLGETFGSTLQEHNLGPHVRLHRRSLWNPPSRVGDRWLALL